MNNVELTQDELIILIQLVKSAKLEVEEALNNEEMGNRPSYILSRDFEALTALQSKLGKETLLANKAADYMTNSELEEELKKAHKVAEGWENLCQSQLHYMIKHGEGA